jgi:hypothetical protein
MEGRDIAGGFHHPPHHSRFLWLSLFLAFFLLAADGGIFQPSAQCIRELSWRVPQGLQAQPDSFSESQLFSFSESQLFSFSAFQLFSFSAFQLFPINSLIPIDVFFEGLSSEQEEKR